MSRIFSLEEIVEGSVHHGRAGAGPEVRVSGYLSLSRTGMAVLTSEGGVLSLPVEMVMADTALGNAGALVQCLGELCTTAADKVLLQTAPTRSHTVRA
jgi:hypothetical protein